MQRSDFRGAILDQTNFDGADLSNAEYTLTGENLAKGFLQGAIVGEVNWMGLDLTGAKLNGAILDGANLQNAILEDVEMEAVSCKGATFYGARYDVEVFARKGWLKQAKVSYLDHRANWSGKSLCESDFRGVIMIGADLSGCDLSECNFDGATLSHCNFRNANFTNASLRGTVLTKADFNGCKVKGVRYGHHPGDFNMWYIASHALIIDPNDDQAVEELNERRITKAKTKEQERKKKGTSGVLHYTPTKEYTIRYAGR